MKELHFNFKDVSVSSEVTEIDIVVNSKNIILHDASGTFKSAISRVVEGIRNRGIPEEIDSVRNIRVGKVDRVNTKGENYFDIGVLTQSSEDTLYILDEDVMRDLTKRNNLKRLHKAKCHLLIIYRENPRYLDISYKDYYITSIVGNKLTFVRKYPDYETWIDGDRYIIEDSSTGFQYFKTRIPNLMTAHGKTNLRKFVDDGIIIADGAALSYEFVELVRAGAQMYLYDCFEALIVRKFLPEQYYNKYQLCDIKTPNYEVYFENIVMYNLPETFQFRYNKSVLDPLLYYADLVDNLPRLFNPVIENNVFTQHVKNFERLVAKLVSKDVWNKYMSNTTVEFRWLVYEYLWYNASRSTLVTWLTAVIEDLWRKYKNDMLVVEEPEDYIIPLVKCTH